MHHIPCGFVISLPYGARCFWVLHPWWICEPLESVQVLSRNKPWFTTFVQKDRPGCCACFKPDLKISFWPSQLLVCDNRCKKVRVNRTHVNVFQSKKVFSKIIQRAHSSKNKKTGQLSLILGVKIYYYLSDFLFTGRLSQLQILQRIIVGFGGKCMAQL